MVTVVYNKSFQAICSRCHSHLEYTYSEVTEHKVNMDYLGDFDLVKGIKCPVCQNVIKHKYEAARLF